MSEPIFFFGTMYGRDELRYIILTSRVLFIFFPEIYRSFAENGEES